MATYKTGIITKNKILQACKELFYEQGYKDSTYLAICKKADVGPKTITHYFKSKKLIAIEIYSDFLINIKEKTKEYMIEKNNDYNLRTATALERIIFTNLIVENENYKKFYYDICVEGLLLEVDIERVDYFYKLHSDEYNLGLSNLQIRLLQITNTSITLGVTRKWLEGSLEGLSTDGYCDYEIRLMYSHMGVSNDEIDQIIKLAYEIYNNMTIVSNEFFLIDII
ncbi:MAG: TetR/AcrR family transcriptional regulator [Eubacteriaceae bacterium]